MASIKRHLEVETLLGLTAQSTERWDDRDVLLYALSVGAGQADPGRELELTTENSDTVDLRVIPTFGVLLTQPTAGIELILEAGRVAGLDPGTVVHGEQAVRLHRPIPVTGVARVEARIAGVHDMGSGAMIVTEATAFDADTDERLLDARWSLFARGAGGFGGERPTPAPWALPSREPDHVVEFDVRPDSALLYRLNGDRNPLHCDPRYARRFGFERPILHGLATYGIAARCLFGACCDNDPARFASMQARFTAPVQPGDTLTIVAWSGSGEVLFRALGPGGGAALDRGRIELAA